MSLKQIFNQKIVHSSALGVLLLLSMPLQADSIQIPGHYNSNQQLVMPKRGNSMNDVLNEFGEPNRRIDPIGEPPISEWDYGDFRVYFEHQTVLHSLNLTTLIEPKTNQ